MSTNTLNETPILQAGGVYKSYGAIKVLQAVDLVVETGSTHAVIGPNGAGKTTLFKVLSGELFSDQGKVEFEGRDVSAEPGYARVRNGMGRTFQVAKVFPDETVLSNMAVAIESRDAVRGFSLSNYLRISRGADVLEE